MADHPLRSATDRRLGKPLPYQLANQTRAHPIPPEFLPLKHVLLWSYRVLITVSSGYPLVWGRLPTRYSPVRRFPSSFTRRIIQELLARLACVKHAASVHPEPGSNSLKKCFKCLSTQMNLTIISLSSVESFASRPCLDAVKN